MPVVYKNRKNKTYYLHQGKTKTGKSKYYFSMKKEGHLVNKIPEGYEIYEHPANAQVFLRKKQPQLITDLEKHVVNKHLKNLKIKRPYLMDVRGNIITIFESSHDPDELKASFGGIFDIFSRSPSETESLFQAITTEAAHYTPVLRFKLVSEKDRAFRAERYCCLGSIDHWIYLDGPEHLGKESFFDLI